MASFVPAMSVLCIGKQKLLYCVISPGTKHAVCYVDFEGGLDKMHGLPAPGSKIACAVSTGTATV